MELEGQVLCGPLVAPGLRYHLPGNEGVTEERTAVPPGVHALLHRPALGPASTPLSTAAMEQSQGGWGPGLRRGICLSRENPPRREQAQLNTSTARRGLPAPHLPCQSHTPFRAQFTAVHFLESTHAKVSFLLHHLLLLPKERKRRLKTTDHCHSMPTKRKHNSLEIHAEVATATVPQPNSQHQAFDASMLQRFPGHGGLPCFVIGILPTENTV